MQGMDISSISDKAVNYGIGGDTTLRVLERVQQYRSVDQSKAIVLLVGLNDFEYRDIPEITDNYIKILDSIKKDTPILVIGLFPIVRQTKMKTNIKIQQLNNQLSKICTKPCMFLNLADKYLRPNGEINDSLFEADGIHLNNSGYDIVKTHIKKSLLSLHGND
jgi:lysophospholipase L1-like esterase